jgi:hypothetical protein
LGLGDLLGAVASQNVDDLVGQDGSQLASVSMRSTSAGDEQRTTGSAKAFTVSVSAKTWNSNG